MSELDRLHEVASWYDSEKDFDRNFIRFEAYSILKQAKGPSVLELGCSSGVMTAEIASHFKKLTVVDGSAKYIEETKRKINQDNVSFFVSLFEEFEPKGTFDDIIMASILEHVDDPIGLLKKVKGWLNLKGRIHITVPNANSLHRRIGKIMGKLREVTELSERDIQLKHRRVYTEELLEQHVKEAGLTVLHAEGIFLKPLSNSQMESWNKDLIDAFYEVGKQLPPDWCAKLYLCCTPS
jgi:2-polyprenyl-3-methyl-5-hydroxy-6-metoxy-1,4-benzoquinol methylase